MTFKFSPEKGPSNLSFETLAPPRYGTESLRVTLLGCEHTMIVFNIPAVWRKISANGMWTNSSPLSHPMVKRESSVPYLYSFLLRIFVQIVDGPDKYLQLTEGERLKVLTSLIIGILRQSDGEMVELPIDRVQANFSHKYGFALVPHHYDCNNVEELLRKLPHALTVGCLRLRRLSCLFCAVFVALLRITMCSQGLGKPSFLDYTFLIILTTFCGVCGLRSSISVQSETVPLLRLFSESRVNKITSLPCGIELPYIPSMSRGTVPPFALGLEQKIVSFSETTSHPPIDAVVNNIKVLFFAHLANI